MKINVPGCDVAEEVQLLVRIVPKEFTKQLNHLA